MISWSGVIAALQRRYWRSRPRIRHRRAEPASTPVLSIHGPTWFRDLFAPEFTLATSDDDHATDLTIVWAEDQADAQRLTSGDRFVVSTPFIQPAIANPSRPRHRDDATLPDDFAQLARSARRTVTPARISRRSGRRDVESWLAATAAAHQRYRGAQHRSATEVVSAALRAHDLADLVPDEEVTVICVTRRPHELDNVIANYVRQDHPHRRLILVTNSSGFDADAVARRLATVDDATMIEMDEEISLGSCLNAAIETTTSRYVAKFDDDDRYGAHYLSDMVLAHRFAKSGVVGKHSHYARFRSDGRAYLRFAGREFTDVSWVAGGTMVIDRERTAALRFEDRSIGEDGAFLSACLRSGHAVSAADRFNYVQHRGDDNTWSQPREIYLRNAIEVTTTDPLEEIER